jgi:hypothetical protein
VACSIAEYIGCSGEVFILAIANINRVIDRHPKLPVDLLTIHRLLLASYAAVLLRWLRCMLVALSLRLVCSAKAFDEHIFNNLHWSNVGGGTSVRDVFGMLNVCFFPQCLPKKL